MTNRSIILKITNDSIFFNPKRFIPIQQTNIPIDFLTFRTNDEIYWLVEMNEYDNATKRLSVKVLDYRTENISKFENQEPKKPIEAIEFSKFDWQGLELILTHYQKSKLSPFLHNPNAPTFSKNELTRNDPENQETKLKQPIYYNQTPKSETPTYIKITDSFWVNFSDSRFHLGYVNFKKRIEQLNQEIDFKIPNDHILPEFENIKFWFAKKLKTVKFKVNISIILLKNVVIETHAHSKHIDQINTELIDSVKYQRTQSIAKVPPILQPDKSLYTADEVFEQINSQDIEGNVFNQSEDDIMKFFLEESTIRNKKQLIYLSGKKQSSNYKVRFTLNPHFGFLFLVEGARNNHFVWELLNSHCTYIWSFEKDPINIKLQFNKIEEIINIVRTSGRSAYKLAYRNNHQDHDLVFRLIKHEGIHSDFIDDFPRWKSRIEEHLT